MRYSGKLGIAQQTEVRPGVWEETITERDVLGTVKQRTEVLEQGDNILPRYSTTTSISVLSRGLGPMDNSMLRYVTWLGKRWQIASTVTDYPHLTFFIREEYHGPVPG